MFTGAAAGNIIVQDVGGTGTGGTSTSSITATFNGLADEDIFVIVGVVASGRTINVPTDWVDIRGAQATNAGDSTIITRLFRRRLTGSLASQAFTINTATAVWCLLWARLSGVHATTPLDVAYQEDLSGDINVSPVCPAITPVTTNALVMGMIHRHTTQSNDASGYPTELTLGQYNQKHTAGSSSTGSTTGHAAKVQATPATTGPFTWTSFGTIARRCNRFTLAVRPA